MMPTTGKMAKQYTDLAAIHQSSDDITHAQSQAYRRFFNGLAGFLALLMNY